MSEEIEQEIDDILREPASLKWVPLSALKAGEYVSCIDGRHANCIIATPGGDAGIFISVMTALEAQAGPLHRAFVSNALDIVMEWHSKFYLHSDEGAVERLFEAAHARQPIALAPGNTAVDFVRRPPETHRDLMRTLVAVPDHVGCGFLKAMLTEPSTFGVRHEVVAWTVLAFYEKLWRSAASAHFEVLLGEHEERAVLYVDTESHDEAPTSFVPAIRGIKEGPSHLFVNHRPARQFLAHETLRLLANAGVLPAAIDMDQAITFIDELCDAQLEIVLQKLAPTLPRYDVTFNQYGDQPTFKKR